jgi:hypothetical protein
LVVFIPTTIALLAVLVISGGGVEAVTHERIPDELLELPSPAPEPPPPFPPLNLEIIELTDDVIVLILINKGRKQNHTYVKHLLVLYTNNEQQRMYGQKKVM